MANEREHAAARRITDPTQARAYVFAGKAIFTLKSMRTGNHITFKVKKPKESTGQGPTHFVSVLDNADGIGGYSYLGAIKAGQLDVGRRSAYYGKTTAPQVTAASWLFAELAAGRLSDRCELWHEGKCGRCGRRLTHPESIASGIGPECASKI